MIHTYIHTYTHTTETHLDVATCQGQLEACLVVVHEVQCDLGVALLLQVGDDRLIMYNVYNVYNVCVRRQKEGGVKDRKR
jgi:hypothetical protein